MEKSQNIGAVRTAPQRLSRRQLEVANLVAQGLTSKEIGRRLSIGERTVEGHIDKIMDALDFHSRAQIAAWVATQDPAMAARPEPAPAPEPRPAPPRLVVARRSIWLTGGALAMVALGIVLVTVIIPLLVTPSGQGPRIATYLGTGIPNISRDNDLARATDVIGPFGLALNAQGNLYLVDGNRIRMVDRTERVQTLAGTGVFGYAGDNGPALEALLAIAGPNASEVTGLAVDSGGDIYFSDTSNNRVREITADHRIVTFAGKGGAGQGALGDGGPATAAVLAQPRGLALDSSGDLFIADTGDNRVRKVDDSGTISTFAGTGALGWGGDGGAPENAELSAPESLAIDVQGDLFIADTGNERIRKVSNGTITTYAGSGTSGYTGDGGPATKAELTLPLGIAVDGRGNLYVSDSGNNRVRRIDLAGKIATVAGDGQAGFAGDGNVATAARLNLPAALAIDAVGNLYIADSGNSRVRTVPLEQ